MDKKDILSQARVAVNERKPGFFARLWRGARVRMAAIWRWLTLQNKLVFFNIALLAIVCALFLVMFVQVKDSKKAVPAAQEGQGYALTERTEVLDLTERTTRPNRPTIIISRNGQPVATARVRRVRVKRVKVAQPAIITLPLRQVQAQIPAVKKVLKNGVMIDGKNSRNVRLAPMTTIEGDLILQNLRRYTLPCGTRVNGDLYLRNVGLLKFCGCFEVVGNIYVSSNSSFGPIPKDAYLGGQVIF